MGEKRKQTSHGGGILRSKLLKPQAAAKLMPREVFTKFADEFESGIKVGLVVAPAGYGKSTLLSQSSEVLTGRGVHCAWNSLDAEDNNPIRFMSHLLAALDTLGSQVFQVDGESFGTPSEAILDQFIVDTAKKLDALDFRHAVFVDDYHVINNPEIHDLLERLVLYSPRKTMFVIASRTEPELAFKTLRMREEVCQVSTQDLAFTLDESEKFLNEAKQLGLNSRLVKALDKRTEGWVAGLQLASLALAGRTDYEEFIEEFSGTDRDVTDYLGEAVLDQQSDEIKHFLLRSSLLEPMNADLANTVLGIDSAQAVLEELDALHLFVIPLDRNRNWYRYHHLFRDFLKVQLAKESPGAAAEIYQKALNWCVSQGRQHEAINYAIRGGLYDRGVELIAGIVKDLLQISGEHWTLLRWVQQLPEESTSRRPEIAVAHSWSLVFSRHYSAARALLEVLDRRCEEQPAPFSPEAGERLRYGINLNMCLLEAACDNSERSSELIKEWLIDNPEAEAGDLLTIYVLQAYAAVSTFEVDLGILAADRAISIGQEYGLDYFEAWGRACAGMLKMHRADLKGAANHYRKGLEVNNRNTSPHSYMGSLNTVLLAEACYEQNNLAEAGDLLADRFEYIDNESVVDVAYAGYRVLAELRFKGADFDTGLNVIRLGRESADRARLPRLAVMLSALEIRSLLKAGRSKEAWDVAKESGFDESQAPTLQRYSRPAIQEIHELVQAEFSLDRKSPKRALRILDEVVVRTENEGRLRRLLEVLLMRCRAFQALKQQGDAVNDLTRALEIGAEGGFYRAFLDATGDLHELVPLLLENSSGRLSSDTMKFLGKINAQSLAELESNQAEETQGESSGALLESLTKRERQMLDRIQTGETNKEIAEKLFISEQTVKWHLHQLYQKLGVKNRTSAIVRAKTLSLI